MFSAWDGGVRREAARFCSCLRLNKELFVNALWNTGTKKWGKEEIQHLKKPLRVHSWHRNVKYLSGLFGTASPSLSNPWQNLSPQLPWYSLTARSPHVEMGNLLPLIHCMVTSETYKHCTTKSNLSLRKMALKYSPYVRMGKWVQGRGPSLFGFEFVSISYLELLTM